LSQRPSERMQPCFKRITIRAGLWVFLWEEHQKPDPAHLSRLLRVRRKWPRCCTAERRDEFSPPHGLTSRSRITD
jgi:hypothetical protein